jgi:hypothetical protein
MIKIIAVLCSLASPADCHEQTAPTASLGARCPRQREELSPPALNVMPNGLAGPEGLVPTFNRSSIACQFARARARLALLRGRGVDPTPLLDRPPAGLTYIRAPKISGPQKPYVLTTERTC